MDGSGPAGFDVRPAARGRADRAVAAARAVLAVSSLAAIWLDPATPTHGERQAYLLLVLYAVYAIAVALVVWANRARWRHLALVTHAVDLVAFSVFMYFTEGPTSPFFVYFVFALLAASLRWQWRGTVLTAVTAGGVFLGMGFYAANVLDDPAFDVSRFVIRGGYLAVMAALIAYLGQHEFRLREELGRLATWPLAFPAGGEERLATLLKHAAGALDAPRVAMIWEEPEEPWVFVATWSAERIALEHAAPGALEPAVAAALAEHDFFCPDRSRTRPRSFFASAGGLSSWRGAPVGAGMARHLPSGPLLALKLGGESAGGWLFAGGGRRFTIDDLIIGRAVARNVSSLMDQWHLTDRVRASSAAEYRLRLARDLHDGVLQSLAAAALNAGTVGRLMASDPTTAATRLREVQDLLVAEQRELRFFINELNPAWPSRAGREPLERSLAGLAERIERQWGLHVDLRWDGENGDRLAAVEPDLYRIVQEALVNAARHAGASTAEVTLVVAGSVARLLVRDDGHGFSFKGRYEHDDLVARRLGPLSLRERVAAVGGSLAIESTPGGACLEVTLPLPAEEA